MVTPPKGHGRLLAFFGKIVETHRTEEGQVVQVLVDQGGPGEVAYVVFPFTTNIEPTVNDSVSVLGRNEGPVTGLNGFGGPTTAIKMAGIAYVSQVGSGCDPRQQAVFEMWKAGTLFKH